MVMEVVRRVRSGLADELNRLFRRVATIKGQPVFAEVVSLGTEAGAPGYPVCNHNVATNGDTFPVDCATVYTYDQSGINITAITRTTPDGVSYKQTWTRNGEGQLQNKSGWVKQ